MIKADAYNHGAEGVAYIANNIVDRFGVATIEEALMLRKLGITKPISIFGCTLSDLDIIKQYSITPVVYNLDLLKIVLLKDFQEFDLKIDSGMRRFGIYSEQDVLYAKRMCEKYNVVPRAIHTHFMSSAKIDEQIFNYNKIIASWDSSSKRILSASTGVLKKHFYDGVRVGLLAYKEALEITSKVVEVKTVKAGEEVGYDGDFVSEKDTNVAIVLGGYYDGIKRAYKGACVKINNEYFKIVGKTSMDTMFVEIGDAPVAINDDVVVLSNDTINSFIKASNTNEYEMLVSIKGRSKRIYEYNGKEISAFTY